MAKERYWLDMDGTLFVFDYVSPDVYTAKGYFRNRPIIPNMIKCAKELAAAGEEVWIVTSVLNDDHSIDEKNESIDEHIGSDAIPYERRVFVPYGTDKTTYIKSLGIELTENDLLVDDYNPNLKTWPGIPVKILNGINGGSNEWTGYSVDHRSEVIANTLRGILQCA